MSKFFAHGWDFGVFALPIFVAIGFALFTILTWLAGSAATLLLTEFQMLVLAPAEFFNREVSAFILPLIQVFWVGYLLFLIIESLLKWRKERSNG